MSNSTETLLTSGDMIDFREAKRLSGGRTRPTLMAWVRRGKLPAPVRYAERLYWDRSAFIAAINDMARGTK